MTTRPHRPEKLNASRELQVASLSGGAGLLALWSWTARSSGVGLLARWLRGRAIRAWWKPPTSAELATADFAAHDRKCHRRGAHCRSEGLTVAARGPFRCCQEGHCRSEGPTEVRWHSCQAGHCRSSCQVLARAAPRYKWLSITNVADQHTFAVQKFEANIIRDHCPLVRRHGLLYGLLLCTVGPGKQVLPFEKPISVVIKPSCLGARLQR